METHHTNHPAGLRSCAVSIVYASSRERRRWHWIDLIRLDGRASRFQWWVVTAISYASMYLLMIPTVNTSIDSQSAPARYAEPVSTQPPVWAGMLVMSFFAVCLSLMLGVSVRRLHDRNKSGWWVLLYFVPVIGPLWLLLELGVLPGTRGPSRYG